MRTSHLIIIPAIAGAVLLGIGLGSSVPTRMLNAAQPRPAVSPPTAEPEPYEPTYRFVNQDSTDIGLQFALDPYPAQYLPEQEAVPEPPYVPYYVEYAALPEMAEIHSEPEPADAQADPVPVAPTAPASPASPPIRKSAITTSIY